MDNCQCSETKREEIQKKEVESIAERLSFAPNSNSDTVLKDFNSDNVQNVPSTDLRNGYESLEAIDTLDDEFKMSHSSNNPADTRNSDGEQNSTNFGSLQYWHTLLPELGQSSEIADSEQNEIVKKLENDIDSLLSLTGSTTGRSLIVPDASDVTEIELESNSVRSKLSEAVGHMVSCEEDSSVCDKNTVKSEISEVHSEEIELNFVEDGIDSTCSNLILDTSSRVVCENEKESAWEDVRISVTQVVTKLEELKLETEESLTPADIKLEVLNDTCQIVPAEIVSDDPLSTEDDELNDASRTKCDSASILPDSSNSSNQNLAEIALDNKSHEKVAHVLSNVNCNVLQEDQLPVVSTEPNENTKSAEYTWDNWEKDDNEKREPVDILALKNGINLGLKDSEFESFSIMRLNVNKCNILK